MRKCTICGKNFDEWDEQENFCFERKIGYGSRYDGETLKVNICQGCLDKIIDLLVADGKNPIKEEDDEAEKER